MATRRRVWTGTRWVRSDAATYPAIAEEIGSATGWRCVYCGEPGLCIDHVIPWSRRGPNDRSNKVLACNRCNSRKGASIEIEWLVPAIRALILRGEDIRWMSRWTDTHPLTASLGR